MRAFSQVPIELPLLFQWLLFRLMFAAGFVKLTSGDPNWRNLSALDFHFFTQPLPNPGAYYAAHLPHSVLACCTALVFFIELVCPFLFFCRRSLRHFAAALTILLQLLIILTGNFAFFNILTIGLALFLFEDDLLLARVSNKIRYVYEGRRLELQKTVKLSWPIAFFFFLSAAMGTSDIFSRLFGAETVPLPLRELRSLSAPLRLVNSYGLFALMTTERNEIVIEGSEDGKNWQPYRFRYKPQDVLAPLPICAPHQPRLDWQMWFAALSNARSNPWFISFLARLAENSPTVTKLLEKNPFPNKPPSFLRALLYRYEFTRLSEKEISGAWWKRTLSGTYVPAVKFQKEGEKVSTAESDARK